MKERPEGETRARGEGRVMSPLLITNNNTEI